MKLWRVAAETRSYCADDLSGGGAAARPGRWNDSGEHVVYSAPSVAMAVLETAAHVDHSGLPLDRFLVEIDVPGKVWRAREVLDASQLPASWAAIPAGIASVRIGSRWLREARSPILLVPSVIVPEDCIALINPAHPKSSGITATVKRPFEFNRLYRQERMLRRG